MNIQTYLRSSQIHKKPPQGPLAKQTGTVGPNPKARRLARKRHLQRSQPKLALTAHGIGQLHGFRGTGLGL